MPKPKIHNCEHCDRAFTGLKYLYNHVYRMHPQESTAQLFDKWARHAEEVKTNNRKSNRPATLNQDGLTYHQFLSQQTAILKETRPEITKQADRVKLISEMWRQVKTQTTNEADYIIVSPEPEPEPETEGEEDIVIVSPEPETLPIPYTLINFMQVNKVVDNVIEEVVCDDIEEIEEIEEVEFAEVVPVVLMDTIEQVESIDQDDQDDKIDIEYDKYLVECYKTWNTGGFVKAYRYMNKNFVIEKNDEKIKLNNNDADVIRPYIVNEFELYKSGKNKGQPKPNSTITTYMTISGIRDKLEYVHNDLVCNYEDYQLATKDEEDYGLSDDWEDVEKELINEDNIYKFFN